MTHRTAEGIRKIWLARLGIGAVVLIAAYLTVLAIADPPTVDYAGEEVESGALSTNEGFVRFNLANIGADPVEIREIEPTATGITVTGVQFPDSVPLEPGDSINVTIIATVDDCSGVDANGTLTIRAERITIFDRSTATLTTPMRDGMTWNQLLAAEVCGTTGN